MALLCAGAGVSAQEYSLIPDSTIIGRNFGYPSGTPGTGLTAVGNLDVVVETAIFLKNLELTGFDDELEIDGETFIGFLAPIRFRYRAAGQVTIELGGVFGHNFGDDDSLDTAEPLVRIVYEAAPNLFLLGGTILPTHWIHDALFDDVQKLREPAEQGLQVRADLEWLKQDTWLNWRIRERADRAEELDVGNATQLRFGGLFLDGQLLWAHVGGQRNDTERTENAIAYLLGASFGMDPRKGRERLSVIEDVRVGGAYLGSHDDVREDETGGGVEVRLTIDGQPTEQMQLRLLAAHFRGDDLLARRGDRLYTLDEYTQVGFNALFALPGDLRLEVGAVGQYAESNPSYTFRVNLVWGRGFEAAHGPVSSASGGTR